MSKKVFVSGCYDLLHSGHVEFFKQAAVYGDLYVGIGSDSTIENLKHHKVMFPEKERLFMVKSIRYVTDAFINSGSGVMDFIDTVGRIEPDVFVVNADGDTPEKEKFCKEHNIEYVVLDRLPHEGFASRSSTNIKSDLKCSIPTRLDIAGTWIDQPYVSCHHPGWALTISLEPTFEIRERCGLSTSTRNNIIRIWPYQLPNMDPETLARLVFCFENNPERSGGHISGAQDAIGICVPGLSRHYYNNNFWPETIETCRVSKVLDWLELHLCLIPIAPRKVGCSVVKGKVINKKKVMALTKAAEDCWNAILKCDLNSFAKAYMDSFNAQTDMFPAMIQGCVPDAIAEWSKVSGVRAWKMPGAGGGGYLALVVEDVKSFCRNNRIAIPLTIRRE